MRGFAIPVKLSKTGQLACFECGLRPKLRYVTPSETDELD